MITLPEAHNPALKNRYFIELAFNGSAYHGWQIQKNAVSVQEILNNALTTILRQPIDTIGCGRTDTGVHAKQLYAHFDLVSPTIDILQSTFIRRVNAVLPRDIAVKQLIKVTADAHARFDATSRSYEYHAHLNKNPFLNGRSWLLRAEPNLTLMNEAAKILLDYQDFSCFSKSNTQTFTNNCTIYNAQWQISNHELIFYISADRFLRNMVRAIVGTLLRIGYHEINLDDMHAIIASKNRSNAGMSVPAHGLYLTEVIYPYIQNQN